VAISVVCATVHEGPQARVFFRWAFRSPPVRVKSRQAKGGARLPAYRWRRFRTFNQFLFPLGQLEWGGICLWEPVRSLCASPIEKGTWKRPRGTAFFSDPTAGRPRLEPHAREVFECSTLAPPPPRASGAPHLTPPSPRSGTQVTHKNPPPAPPPPYVFSPRGPPPPPLTKAPPQFPPPFLLHSSPCK